MSNGTIWLTKLQWENGSFADCHILKFLNYLEISYILTDDSTDLKGLIPEFRLFQQL